MLCSPDFRKMPVGKSGYPDALNESLGLDKGKAIARVLALSLR
ncbi:hypothetical protein B0O95_10611 [Mycetohabitans endofungorum]|uniref:Uncharacterized protein n=1 Tax=Mycetohabitans endofungorum TaxID=417203 RepID=A0A2P5KA79_9BURK|nr:hypothetical protein B0O95_10611 [Mycetohabitans endofungorum]